MVAGDDGKLRFRLADGREFGSPSAAGSAVMGGISCNGWRFWSLAGERPTPRPAEPTAGSESARKPGAKSAKRSASGTREEVETKAPEAGTEAP